MTFNGGAITAASRRGTRQRDRRAGHRVAQHLRQRPRHARADARSRCGRRTAPRTALDRLRRASRASDLGPARVHVHHRRQPTRRAAAPGSSSDPAVHLIGDGSFLRYRRLDSNDAGAATDRSSPARTSCCRAAGFSSTSRGSRPGLPCHERSAARSRVGVRGGRVRLWSRVRLFGGWDAHQDQYRSGSRRFPRRANLPRNTGTRGVRRRAIPARQARRSLTLRVEEGDRDRAARVHGPHDARATRACAARNGSASFGRYTTYARYRPAAERRQLGDRLVSYTQDDVAGQLFVQTVAGDAAVRPGGVTRYITALRGRHDLLCRSAAAGSSSCLAGTSGCGAKARQPQRRSADAGLRAAASRSTSASTASSRADTTFACNIAADRMPLLFGIGTSMDDALDGSRDADVFDRRGARHAGVAGIRHRGGARARHRHDRRSRLHRLERQRHAGSRRRAPGEHSRQDHRGRIGDDAARWRVLVSQRADRAAAGRPRHRGGAHRLRSAGHQRGRHRARPRLDAAGLVRTDSARHACAAASIRDANGNGKVDPGEEPINGAVLYWTAAADPSRCGGAPIDSTRFAAATTWSRWSASRCRRARSSPAPPKCPWR